MDNVNLQRLIDSPDSTGTVKLPAGEFEGPFVVSRPCTIVGNNTTLWRKSGTVAEIRSRGVCLKNLQIEITGDCENEAALHSLDPDVRMENTVIYGRTLGVSGEDGFWGIPKVVSPGRIPSGKSFEIVIEIEAAAQTGIVSNIVGVTAAPSSVPAGRSEVKLIVEPLSDGTVIYGDIEFRSKLVRRTYLSLSADKDAVDRSGEKLYTAPAERREIVQNTPAAVRGGYVPQRTALVPSETNSPAAPQTAAARPDNGRLIRGQRVNVTDILGDGEITAELFYTSMDTKLDIDTYTFLLNEEKKAENDESLIFFGNERSTDGSVFYTDDGQHRLVHFDLKRVPRSVQYISIAFSIYGGDPQNNFGRLHGGMVVFRCGNTTAEFPLDGLFSETTVVAAELYRRGDIWKLSAVGQGYRRGLKPLCESFGLVIMDS
ncbi:MAG: TerD family protein [Oscillospiraceae bacterium]